MSAICQGLFKDNLRETQSTNEANDKEYIANIKDKERNRCRYGVKDYKGGAPHRKRRPHRTVCTRNGSHVVAEEVAVLRISIETVVGYPSHNKEFHGYQTNGRLRALDLYKSGHCHFFVRRLEPSVSVYQ